MRDWHPLPTRRLLKLRELYHSAILTEEITMTNQFLLQIFSSTKQIQIVLFKESV